jgi:hypothetical protein
MPKLIDGTEVASDDLRWRDECRARANHLYAMQRLDNDGRAQYLQDVARSEGVVAAERLRDEWRESLKRWRAWPEPDAATQGANR